MAGGAAASVKHRPPTRRVAALFKRSEIGWRNGGRGGAEKPVGCSAEEGKGEENARSAYGLALRVDPYSHSKLETARITISPWEKMASGFRSSLVLLLPIQFVAAAAILGHLG